MIGEIFNIFKLSVRLYISVQIIRDELNGIDYEGENSEEDEVGPVFHLYRRG